MFILWSLIRLLMAIMLVVGCSRVALAQVPDSSSWNTSEVSNVMTVPWTAVQISTFLMSVTNTDDPISIGDFKFVDLLGDGNIQLLATADYSGRELFNTLLIVRRNGAVFSIQKIPTLGMDNLSGVAADLNGDGKLELLIPKPFTPYLGGSFPQVKWVAIYTSSGSIFTESSMSFATYYVSSILPKLQQALDAAKLTNDPVLAARAQLEFDKAVRVSTAGSEVGIATAQVLSSNTDPNLRIWAADVLADIRSPAALRTLAILAQDPDPMVASYAKAAQREAALNSCERIAIDIKETINLASKDLIRVAVPINSIRGAERRALKIKEVTFGEVGHEQSLVNCNDSNRGGITCMFRTANTGLQPGDGVATLRASYVDGTCIIGQGGVRVIGNP